MLILTLRVHALYYDKSRLIIGFVAFILVAETATNVYLLIHAIRMPMPRFSLSLNRRLMFHSRQSAVPHQKYQDQVHCEYISALVSCRLTLLIACSMIYNAGAAGAVASAWIPLFYDTVVMLLTMYITVPTIRRSAKGFIVWTIFRDGLLYYAYVHWLPRACCSLRCYVFPG